MKAFTIKINHEKLSQFWQEFEIEADIQDVIFKAKTIQNVFDVILLIKEIGEACIATSKIAQDFLTKEERREQLAESCDGIVEISGSIGFLLETLDKTFFKKVFDMLAQPVEVEE